MRSALENWLGFKSKHENASFRSELNRTTRHVTVADGDDDNVGPIARWDEIETGFDIQAYPSSISDLERLRWDTVQGQLVDVCSL